jgi:hypothetical protein
MVVGEDQAMGTVVSRHNETSIGPVLPAPRPGISRLRFAFLGVVVALAAMIEFGWWWSSFKFRVQAAIPWKWRRRLFIRPPSHR